MNTVVAGAWVAVLFSPFAVAGETEPPAAAPDRYSYSVGFQVGADFRREGLTIDPAALERGIRDALAAREPAISMQEMRAELVAVKQRMVASEQQRRAEEKEKYRQEGTEFRHRNGRQPGVVTTPSGLQYKVLAEGSGPQPKPGDTVTVEYRGTLVDGSEFDSSYKRGKPATFRLDGVIAGWREALPMMKEGARWQIVVPPELAYDEKGPLADRTLLFEISLLSVASPAK